ncbi:MAG: hypothetical protein A2046_00895 [Bacteroidetes bacterium GWA2_30_7]|nr:MAG: hypothetical protein A2046_00895 [Bacteroidetes bacterium GWA2_30_7]
MKTIIAIVFLGIISLTTTAQEKQKVEKPEYNKLYKHSLGAGAGFTTGLGISYRYFPKKLGFQLNVAPHYQDYGKEAFISAGLTFLYNLSESKYSAVYAYFGNHLLHTSEVKKQGDSFYNSATGYYEYTYTDHTVVKDVINSGIGFGFEFNTQKRVTLNLMGGYAQYNSFERLFFTIEAALYYRFN